jgi:hypothetical protein
VAFDLKACDARIKKWRHRLRAGQTDAAECWSNIDSLLTARLRLQAGEQVEKPWETDDPIPDGA